MIPLWQNATRKMFDEATALLPAADNAWDAGSAAATALVREARELLELVRVDGSWGVHNPRYTQQLIEKARAKLLEAKAMVEKGSAGS
jgi:hypothetical protein